VATRNEHKLRELRGLIAGHELVPLPADVELPPETGSTFAENARIKARAAARASRQPAIADDSGIEAAALGGRPGVRSARFAGEHATDAENLERLLREVPADGDRRVSYVCALAYAEPDGREELFEGTCSGALAAEPRGTGGVAALDPAEKDAISHRGRAARMLVDWLETARAAAR